MKDKQERDCVESLMADIAQYERMIGELIEQKEALSSQVAHSEDLCEAMLENRIASTGADVASLQVAVMRLATQQSRNMDTILRHLTQMHMEHFKTTEPGPILTDAFGLSLSCVSAMENILSGKTVEDSRSILIAIEPDSGVRAVRGELYFTNDLDHKGRTSIVLKENNEFGVHAMIFPLTGVTATGLRSISIEIMARNVTIARLRLRHQKSSKNFIEMNVNLRTGQYANFRSGHPIDRRNVMVRVQNGGWKNILMEAALFPQEGNAELEVIALETIKADSSKRSGSTKDAFAIRSLRATRSEGLVATNDDFNGEAVSQNPDSPTIIQYNVQMPAEERRRAEKREAYLASGAYRSLTRFRNLHEGKRAFIIGNGPSINEQDLTLLKDEITFTTNWFVNHPQYSEIDPKYYCVSSHEMFGGWDAENPQPNPDWLERMLNKAGDTHKFISFPFRKCLVDTGLFLADKCDFLLFDRPKYQIDLKGGINLDLTQPMDDGYTGIVTFCLPLAHFMGIRKIYLIGCDSNYGPVSDGAPKAYFYDFSQHMTRTTSETGLLRAWADNGPVFKTYEIVRNRFALDGVQIINSTRGGRLEVFPRVEYETVIQSKE